MINISVGIINVLNIATKTIVCPRKVNLANVYPTSESKNTTETVLKVATQSEFNIQRRNLDSFRIKM